MSKTTLPLLRLSPTEGSIVEVAGGQSISREIFLAQVQRVATKLPTHRYAFNLCEDRYLFMVAFVAVLWREQTNLLPAYRHSSEIQKVAANYPDSYCLTDHPIADLPLPQHLMDVSGPCTIDRAIPEIAAEQIAAIVFTSGSTGQPCPHPKTWHSLVTGARLAQQRFLFPQPASIVATVPPQHMYGLETSILLPLVMGLRIHNSRPFFPQDISQTLMAVPPPRLLVTTPIHLKACVQSNLSWPALTMIISATAPLSHSLAAQAETVFSAPVWEIYGCTEAGSLASRHPLESDQWQLYDGFWLSQDERNGCYVHGDHLFESVPLKDVIAIDDDRHFRLLGRQHDLINIAGKRASLSDLNRQLNEIAGVADGIFIMPAEAENEEQIIRLIALVVAPARDEATILTELAQRLDPAFLPRPLYKVSRLPRNDTSKLPYQELIKLLKELEETK